MVVLSWLRRIRPRPWQMEVALWLLVLLAGALLWCWFTSEPSVASGAMPDGRTCAAFPSWESAQKAYRDNPEGLRHLDGDRDGVACEALK